tara:strand:+ start:574 stop:1422 length:849 start_codon:yes stop_codon:yes gene_type:complete
VISDGKTHKVPFMNLNEITPLILTYNEQDNLTRTLAALNWAKQIVIVDSGSDDKTLEIASEFANVKLVTRSFDSHTNQWNFGLSKVSTEWVLTLDADYQCTPELVAELRDLNDGENAYAIGFNFLVFGRKLRGSIYPPRVCLFPVGNFQYRQDGHTQLLDLSGIDQPPTLDHRLNHDDRKPVARWLRSQCKYADLEVEKLFATDRKALGWKDRIRTWIVLAPPLTLVYCLFAKGMILDGWAGLYYTLQRVIAELILSLKLLDYRLRHEDVNRPAIAESQPER